MFSQLGEQKIPNSQQNTHHIGTQHGHLAVLDKKGSFEKRKYCKEYQVKKIKTTKRLVYHDYDVDDVHFILVGACKIRGEKRSKKVKKKTSSIEILFGGRIHNSYHSWPVRLTAMVGGGSDYKVLFCLTLGSSSIVHYFIMSK